MTPLGHLDLVRILDLLPGIVVGLTVHEFAHAWAAWSLGDSTAKAQGRLTLNPLEHLDLWGFVFIVFAGFGWAKPVSFREENLVRPERDVRLIALAGPLSNGLLAVVLTAVYAGSKTLWPGPEVGVVHSLFTMLYGAIWTNWGLMVFNLLPLPPLDGSHVLFYQFRHKTELYSRFYRYGTIGLFAALVLESYFHLTILPIAPAVDFLAKGFFSLFSIRV